MAFCLACPDPACVREEGAPRHSMQWLWRLALVAVSIGLAHGEEEADKVVDGFSDNDRAKMAKSSEKHEFQAEVNRLMDIIINSLYTDKQELGVNPDAPLKEIEVPEEEEEAEEEDKEEDSEEDSKEDKEDL
eukprot:s668_g11.t1